METSIACRALSGYRRDRHLEPAGDGAVRLAPTLLLTNEAGVNGDLPDPVGGDDWARVEFDLPSAGAAGALLLFYVKQTPPQGCPPLRLQVNGRPLRHRPEAAAMLTGGWDRVEIPARLLRPGRNAFVFCGPTTLHIDPGPGRMSARSFDGGATWHKGALGPRGDQPGEYLVRLRIKGHPPQGALRSPVFDLADPGGDAGVAPLRSWSRLRLEHAASVPQGTRLRFELRSGSTPAFDARHWTPWRPGLSLASPDRFAQWRAVLSSRAADRTPVLRGVSLRLTGRAARKAPAAPRLLESDQPELAYGSYEFAYLKPHPRAERLVRQYRLDQVIAAGRTELEQFALLRDWVHSQWLGWQADKYPYCPPWDPLEILETTKGNWGFGMCTHYGAVFAGCAAALGFVARVLVVDHHCLAEIWSDQLQKWILQDPGPNREYDATYERRGLALNALEFHQAHAAGQAHRLTINKLPQRQKARMTQQWGGLFRRFAIPLRNDHLVRAEPAELHHGYSQYHWDGYLWWTTDMAPPYAEYSLQTTRPQDFYWSVNQTRLYPRQTGEAGVLAVDIETATPNFSHFERRTDGGQWTAADAPLRWVLHEAENTLEVRGVNAFGRPGRSARLRVSLD